MRKLSEKVITGSFSLALLLLCGVGVASYQSLQQFQKDKQSLIHTYQVLATLDKVDDGLLAAESGRRAYILTGKADYLETYAADKQKVYQNLKALRLLTQDNANQQRRLDTLEPLSAKRFVSLDRSLSLYNQNKLDLATQIAITDQGREIRTQLLAIRQAMEAEEESLLQRRTILTDKSVNQFVVVMSIGYCLSFILLVIVYWLLQKQIHVNKTLSEEAMRLEQQAAKARLAKILESITDAFIALDRNWCYTYVNQKAGELLNHKPEELIGKNIWEEFPEGVGKEFYQAYHQAVEEQRMIELEQYYPSWEGWFESRIYPSEEGISVFFQDFTPRKLAEIALEQSERRYRSLVLATSQAVWITDAQGKVDKDIPLWRALTGQREAEVKGWGWLDRVHPRDWERTKHLWNLAVATQGIYQTEHRVQVQDGTYRYFLMRGVPVLNAEGQIVEWVGTHTDITERKLAEYTLEQANEALEIKVQQRTAELQRLNEYLKSSNQQLEQFAYVASHDLQEPLRAVTGYTQLLEVEYQDRFDDSAKKYMTEIVDGAKRMQHLIQDLLAYSRIGTRGKEFALTDCNAVLTQVLKNLQLAIAQSNAIITQDPLPNVLADKTQLLQLFQNLIGNAIKFRREEPPQIHIGVVRGTGGVEGENTPPSSPTLHTLSENEVLFWIRDNGIGIKPQYLERIFEIFRRLHTRREFPGTGIGLAVCKKIVERHGGSIWAESEPGVGTTFYFTLRVS
ncbi:sensor histidine kinase [Mastigocladopsis repens]|uniref:sensor histidine kinase n=1 Tax=Mastigocladopsis repens TaxID=221287 RepID=UPI0002F5E467|nr:PAS domain S-box protein [Mastigocladopsis repens]